jgi:hypothetical protein
VTFRPRKPIVAVVLAGTFVFFLIALNNGFIGRLGVGGIISVGIWLALGQVLLRLGSGALTRALVGGWTGFVSAGTNLVLREWLRLPGEWPGIGAEFGDRYLVAGVPSALLYWSLLGAVFCSLFGSFRGSSPARWLGLLTLAVLSCSVAFYLAGYFMQNCGACL